jgi:transposase
MAQTGQPSETERKLQTENAELKKRNAELEERNRKLQQELNKALTALACARKTSGTSSKPPSSDIVKARAKDEGGKEFKRKIGAQPGHPRHARAPFPPERIDAVQEHRLNACPDCGGSLRQTGVEAVIQQAELVARPVKITEHRAWGCECEHCGAKHVASFPATVEKGGLLGPRLTSLGGYLKGACHASYTTAQKFFDEVLGLALSRGYLAKLILLKNSRALAQTHERLRARLPFQSRLNVDETGHKQNGKLLQSWCFHAPRFTLFRTGLGRGAEVLRDTLGEYFTGILTCDYFSAYQKFSREWDADLSFCWAHLIRDVRFLTTLPDGPTRGYGDRLLASITAMFHCWHTRQPRLARQGELLQHRAQIEALALRSVPHTAAASNLARRFEDHANEYFRFITLPRLDPTNNAAEQDERFVVIDRHITQGTRSESGNRWCERIWTVTATCARQERSVFDFLFHALTASFENRPTPSLLLNTP